MAAGVAFHADTNIVTDLHVLVVKLFHVKRLDRQGELCFVPVELSVFLAYAFERKDFFSFSPYRKSRNDTQSHVGRPGRYFCHL